MEKEKINTMLKRIGKRFFITYLIEVFENKYNYSEITSKENITLKSCYSRISMMKKMIRGNEILTALEICKLSKLLSNDYIKLDGLIDYSMKFQSSKKSIELKINFVSDHDIRTDLSDLDDLQIIKLYADVVYELKNRKIIRSAKITGDLGESFVINHFNENKELPNLELIANKSNKSFDAFNNQNNNKYEIKTITQSHTSNIKYISGTVPFDFLIICKLDNNYYVENLYQLSFKEFENVKKHKSQDTWFVKIDSKDFLQFIDLHPKSVLM